MENFKYDRQDFTHLWILRITTTSFTLLLENALRHQIFETDGRNVKKRSDICLTCFYTSARKKDGTYYKSSSMKSILWTSSMSFCNKWRLFKSRHLLQKLIDDLFLPSPPHNKKMDERALFDFENLIKQLFHSPALDSRLIMVNSALGASLAISHLVSNGGSWNNC